MHELRRGGKKIVLSYDIIRMHYANNTSLHSDLFVSSKLKIKKKQFTAKFKIAQKGGKQFCNTFGDLRNIQLYTLGITRYKFLSAL